MHLNASDLSCNSFAPNVDSTASLCVDMSLPSTALCSQEADWLTELHDWHLQPCALPGCDCEVCQPIYAVDCHKEAKSDSTTLAGDETETSGSKWKRKGRGSNTMRRNTTSKACTRCRSMKRKCDSARPCLCCIRAGCAGSCVDWEQGRDVSRNLDPPSAESGCDAIERPIPWRACVTQRSVGKNEPVHVALDVMMTYSARNFLQLLFRKMISHERALSWGNAFSDDLCDALAEFVKVSQMQNERLRRGLDQKGSPTKPGLVEEFGLDAHPGTPCLSYNMLENRVGINEELCRVTGTHPEEVLARLEVQDAYFMLSELDAFLDILDAMQYAANGSPHELRCITRYRVAIWSWDKQKKGRQAPVLMKATTQLRFDEHGTVRSSQVCMQRISAPEYNTALDSAPHLCRPVAGMLGDRRRGEQLLAEYEFEKRCSMAELCRVPCYSARLSALAQHLRTPASPPPPPS